MIIVSRAPLRVSFFGGGTDYPEYFQRAPGAVLGMAINKYVYVMGLSLSDTLDFRYRVSYSRIETVSDPAEIEHPVVRAVLQHYDIRESLALSVLTDLPSRSGLGSSSSFTVCCVNLVAHLQGRPVTKLDLAREAIYIERALLHENVGVQDQHHAAFGGLNRFEFHESRVRICPVQMPWQCLAALNESLFLVYTGINRYASKVLDEQMERTRGRAIEDHLSHLYALTEQGVGVLEGQDPDRMLIEFGAMLHESWETKKQLSPRVSNPQIDALYDATRAAGALGGKLCGAGSGGFLLVLVPPNRQRAFRERMAGASIVPITQDTLGATIEASGRGPWPTYDRAMRRERAAAP